MKKHYYILSNTHRGTMCNYMLFDLKSRQNVTFLYSDSLNRPIRNRYINRLVLICMRIFWEAKKRIYIAKILRHSRRDDKQVWMLLPNELMSQITVKELNRLQRSGVKVAALLIDPIRGKYPSAPWVQEKLANFTFDKIFTFDPHDAQENGWSYTNTLYSRFPVNEKPVAEDLFYIGSVKDRLAACKELLSLMQVHGVKAFFKLACNAEQAKELPENAVLKAHIPYSQMLNLLQSAKCIFDMTQQGQSGVTLRYYEAVMFNKKLLTNNRNISKLPFYDPRYMRIYDSFADIDWDWVRTSDMPDYGYTDQFSPIHLLELMN